MGGCGFPVAVPTSSRAVPTLPDQWNWSGQWCAERGAEFAITNGPCLDSVESSAGNMHSSRSSSAVTVCGVPTVVIIEKYFNVTPSLTKDSGIIGKASPCDGARHSG